MKSYIAETKSGKLFEFKLADNAEDGWDCIQSQMSANPYWRSHKTWNPSDPHYVGWTYAQYIVSEKSDGSLVMGDKKGWLVSTEDGNILRNMEHLYKLYSVNMGDPIVTIYNESLNAIPAEALAQW